MLRDKSRESEIKSHNAANGTDLVNRSAILSDPDNQMMIHSVIASPGLQPGGGANPGIHGTFSLLLADLASFACVIDYK